MDTPQENNDRLGKNLVLLDFKIEKLHVQLTLPHYQTIPHFDALKI